LSIDSVEAILYELLEVFENLLIEFRYGTVVHLGNNERMLDDVADLRNRLKLMDGNEYR